jgi:hypothetical protein
MTASKRLLNVRAYSGSGGGDFDVLRTVTTKELPSRVAFHE